MDSTDLLDEKSTEYIDSNTSELTSDSNSSSTLITGFLWLFFLFMATTYLSQAIIFQTLNNFFEDVKNMEDICNGDGDNFNDEKCECVFNYLEGLDHPQFQFYFQKLQLPGIHKSKKDQITEQSDPKIYLIDPKAYVIACGNNAPERKMANKEVCDELDKLIITDLYTKWWYDPAASCFNSILNTTKRSHPGAVLAFSLVLLGIVLTPIRLLQNL